MSKEIYICFDDAYTENPAWVGVLSAQQVRGREVFSFEFADDWCALPHSLRGTGNDGESV